MLFDLRQIDNRSVVLYLTAQAIKGVEEERDDAGNNSVLLSCLSLFFFFSDRGLSRMWRMATRCIPTAAMVSERNSPGVLMSLVYPLWQCTDADV